ncbi:hypothetical protein [Pseudomarimonas arenosa]|uniref:Uncharacterized protein n=1 Tax=Pseudomarimonas arenosa TaxID=2774145 RepID=A0AAW3ZN38_9GAMM|nr:hypothetical protein [Pseudomarimonas arenosa]MBD8526487.1 hypothetical protein [Pseudomarimonas arenosa]
MQVALEGMGPIAQKIPLKASQSSMRSLYPFEIRRNALALRIGTDLPKPRKLTVRKPGFSLGSCERMHFTPSGAHLIAVTVNGTHLWEVATGKRILKLAVPSNPTEVTFSCDGAQALVRNEQGQFVRLSLSDGSVLAKFKAKYPWRLDGTPGLGPDNRVLQLAYEGRLLELDGKSGKVLRDLQLEPTGYSGEIYWMPQNECWMVAQRSVDNGRGRSVPCALWRWDRGSASPCRLPGQWDQLTTARVSGGEALLLHHAGEPGRASRGVLERFNISTATTTPIGDAPVSIASTPSLAHDGGAFGVAGDDGPHIDIGGEVLQLPGRAYVQFHPAGDLVGISGRTAFVAPRGDLAKQIPDLHEWRLQRELEGRGYSRLSALGGTMPPRIVVFAREDEWLVQAERIEGRYYVPLAEALLVEARSEQAIKPALAEKHNCSRVGVGIVEPTTNERRSFHGSTLTPPCPGWRSAVAVAFAGDAVDVWPLKPTGATAFVHDCYPVAALAPDIDMASLISAIRKMLVWFKPRRD